MAVSNAHCFTVLTLLVCSWQAAKARDMNNVYYEFIERAEVARIARLEMFDEVEEFHLIMGHYCIVVATNEPGLGEGAESR
jgi:hypothetical protein